jgi:tetratricopeptide (TPR) repeat protein
MPKDGWRLSVHCGDGMIKKGGLLFATFLSAGILAVSVAAESPRPGPVLVPGIQQPDEMRVAPFPTKKVVLTAPEKELAEATNNFLKIDATEMLLALDGILAKYPDFADGYVFRIAALCDNDRRKALSDVNNALKHMTNSRSIKDTVGAILSMRAKLMFADGDYAGAMEGLEQAVKADLHHATQITNSGAVKPEKTASVCVWTKPDMDLLVQRFPADYRSYLFRGVYFSKFAPLDEASIKPAIENFDRAAKLNPTSALPLLFKAELHAQNFIFYGRLSKLGWGDAERDKLSAELVSEYGNALLLDPNLLPALKGRANAYLSLKQFSGAIADYDRSLSLDSRDLVSYHDRGLAELQLGRDHEAISDFSSAIKLLPAESHDDFMYKSRADAYMKIRQWDLAIRDLTTAISFQVASHLLTFMNIEQFRAVYPEYKSISDEVLSHKLHQTFLPDLTYEGAMNSFLHRHDTVPSFLLDELYIKRSDAYLKKDDWHRAAIEFRRAEAVPGSAHERWREVGQTADGRNYIDMKTFDDARRDSVRFWIKQPRGENESDGAYTLLHFELNCTAERLRTLAIAKYGLAGELLANREGGKWETILPETVGESLHAGACR